MKSRLYWIIGGISCDVYCWGEGKGGAASPLSKHTSPPKQVVSNKSYNKDDFSLCLLFVLRTQSNQQPPPPPATLRRESFLHCMFSRNDFLPVHIFKSCSKFYSLEIFKRCVYEDKVVYFRTMDFNDLFVILMLENTGKPLKYLFQFDGFIFQDRR